MAAKFHHPVLLCGNINIKNLVGVTIGNDSSVLITTNASVKQYNVSDRKQINSWTTKSWEPFTSPAVHSLLTNEIVAVINNSSLCKWSLEDKDINDIKKIKLRSKVHKILGDQSEVYLLYKSGYIHTLDEGLSSSKVVHPRVIGANELIIEAQIVKNQVILFTSNKNGVYTLYRVNKSSADGILSRTLKMNGLRLLGSCLFSTGRLLSMWSDGNVYSLDMFSHDVTFGHKQGHIKRLNPSARVKIIEITPTHASIQGLSANNEGGLAVLWDTKFGICIDTKPFKMYVDPPQGWYINSGIVVADVGSLAYVPISITLSTLASLFGSKIEDNNELQHVNILEVEGNLVPSSAKSREWQGNSCMHELVTKLGIFGSVSENISSHWLICEVIKKNDVDLLTECIEKLSFISEESLILLIKFFVGLVNQTNNTNQSEEECPLSPFSESEAKWVNVLLCKPFSRSEILTHLSSLGFSESLLLIRHLHHVLASGKSGLVSKFPNSDPPLKKVVLWLSLLLDTNYHQLVMTSEIEVQRDLQSCFRDISSLSCFLEASHSIDPLVDQIEHFKPLPTPQADIPYTIERIVIS